MPDDTTSVPLSSDNLSFEYTFMDPDYLALLREDFDITTGRGGVLWNTFMYGVEYDPTEEVWVDADGNIVDREQMLNPDYVPAGEDITVTNPEWTEWQRLNNSGDPNEWDPEPPKTITTPATPAQGEEYIDDPSITPTTRGEFEQYNPDEHFTEYEAMVLGFEQQQALIPAQTEAELAGLTESTKTSELGTAEAESGMRLLPEKEAALSSGYTADTAESGARTATANRAIDLIKYGEEQGLGEAEIDAQLAAAGFTKADADYAKELLTYRRETGVDTAGIDFEKQSIMDKSLALTQRAPVREALYNQALSGLDTEKYAREAAATASGTYDASKEGLNRQLQRRGVNPGAITTDDSMERASVISNAKTGARNWAEQESFNRLNTALNNTGA